MDLYQVHSVKILGTDQAKADEILAKHISDIDDIRVSSQKNSDGVREITYWIRPYIYNDFETILNEFELEGIRII